MALMINWMMMVLRLLLVYISRPFFKNNKNRYFLELIFFFLN